MYHVHLQTCVAFIRGVSQNTTEDALLSYFENTKGSGGGNVEEIDTKGDWACIKFESTKNNENIIWGLDNLFVYLFYLYSYLFIHLFIYNNGWKADR